MTPSALIEYDPQVNYQVLYELGLFQLLTSGNYQDNKQSTASPAHTIWPFSADPSDQILSTVPCNLSQQDAWQALPLRPIAAATDDIDLICCPSLDETSTPDAFSPPDSADSDAACDIGHIGAEATLEAASTNTSRPRLRPRAAKPGRHACPHPACGKTFAASGTLRTHLLTHTGVRNFACTLCPATYTTSGRLTIHLRDHSGETPYHCHFRGCGYQTKQSCSLASHTRRHLSTHEKQVAQEARNQERFSCSVCQEQFKTYPAMAQHKWKLH
ncbi:hypothetical protein BDR26DRAFT_862761 [Obelidium mucronatum]|nr:hypothetical protein BDR26DRAFT_862761 [Obelidium mucronatum]